MNSTEINNTESLSIQSSEENTINNNLTLGLINYEDLPIVAKEWQIGEQKKWCGMVGLSKCTHFYDTAEEVEKVVREIGIKNWELVISIITAHLHAQLEVIHKNLNSK